MGGTSARVCDGAAEGAAPAWGLCAGRPRGVRTARPPTVRAGAGYFPLKFSLAAFAAAVSGPGCGANTVDR